MRAMFLEMDGFHIYWSGDLEKKLVPDKQMWAFCGIYRKQTKSSNSGF